MLFSEAFGRPVVSVTTAETVGTVTACVVGGRPARITAFRLKTRGLGGHIVTWDNVRSFGEDAVIIDSMEKLRPDKHLDSRDPAHQRHDPLGKPVLTETGELRGTVEDVDFDQQTGRVQHLLAAMGASPEMPYWAAGTTPSSSPGLHDGCRRRARVRSVVQRLRDERAGGVGQAQRCGWSAHRC